MGVCQNGTSEFTVEDTENLNWLSDLQLDDIIDILGAPTAILPDIIGVNLKGTTYDDFIASIDTDKLQNVDRYAYYIAWEGENSVLALHVDENPKTNSHSIYGLTVYSKARWSELSSQVISK